MKYIISESQYKRILSEDDNNCLLPEGSWADAIRHDLILQFFEDVNIDDEYNIDEPEYDLLLDPHDGYDYQTYIQNDLDNGRFIFYEGFSLYCWKSFLSQKQYKGLSKSEIIESFIKNRGSKLGESFGYELVDYSFEIYDTFDFSDYILLMVFKKL
jgi:hypothetical protein